MSTMETKSADVFRYLFLLLVLLTKMIVGYQIIGGYYNVFDDHVPEGQPFAELTVHSITGCVTICQKTVKCTATMNEKRGTEQLCKLCDKNITISERSSNSTTQTLVVKGK